MQTKRYLSHYLFRSTLGDFQAPKCCALHLKREHALPEVRVEGRSPLQTSMRFLPPVMRVFVCAQIRNCHKGIPHVFFVLSVLFLARDTARKRQEVLRLRLWKEAISDYVVLCQLRPKFGFGFAT
jgi:hypothetical protein